MASIASLANLGSGSIISLGNFDSYDYLVRRVSFQINGSNFRRHQNGNRWSFLRVCKSSLTTSYTSKQGTSVSHDSMYRGSNDKSTDTFPEEAPEINGNSNSNKLFENDDERSMLESLEELLEKAKKVEAAKKANVLVKRPLSSEMAKKKDGKPVSSVESSNRKSKTLKSVWRKGNPVASIEKVVEGPVKQEPRIDGGGMVGSRIVSSNRSHRTYPEVQPKLQAKPLVNPSPSIKKMNDMDSADKSSVADLAEKSQERKPILIDKFASRKPVVDSLITKPGKGFGPSKFKGEFRKKSGSSERPRRHMVNNDNGIPEEDAAELDVPIPGATNVRKGRKWSKASRKAARLKAARDAAPVKVEIMEVGADGMLTEELAYNLAISEGEILGYLYSKGIKPDGVQKLSLDMVKMVCKMYGVDVLDSAPIRVEEMAKKREILDEDDLDKLEDRPPVLTIMGHVDHGKTTLLDFIRKSKVAAAEAGGITQGIGAYKVEVPVDGKKEACVFLDTPGHEAFGAMRARGARVTDIVVIVVAADDGIQPQTKEAIAHAKAAGVPIIVAINKMDKDGANSDRVIQDLSSVGLMPEDWGGDVPMVKISALKGENVDDLLETIMLIAELQELKANPHRNAKGTVIEAGLDKAKGPVATFIVQNGTLRRGDVVVCGEAFGKVRALFDDGGKRVDAAGPSTPVQVIGLNNVPLAGDEFEVVGSLGIARERAEERAEYLRNQHITEKAGDGKVTLASLASAVSMGKNGVLDLHQLNIILKVDVQGSIEAIRQALQVLPQDNITLKFLLHASGDVSNSDVDLAVASKAIIFGFNVKAPSSVKTYADNKNVEIRLYKVIYELIEDVRNAMEGLLDPVEERVQIGVAEVRAVFSSGSGRVAGCLVSEGKVSKECGIRIVRKGKEIHVGVLSSLRRVKEMVKEVNAGLECGIGTEGFDDWEEGDMVVAFNAVQKKRSLEEASAAMSTAIRQVGILHEDES